MVNMSKELAKYHSGIEIQVVDSRGCYSLTINSKAVGRLYNNSLTYFHCGKCKNQCIADDGLLPHCCLNDNIVEDKDEKIYCTNYEEE